MLEVEERFELLQDQVDVLSLKLRESNKWQKALEKWLRNTFKLDVSELVRNDALKSGDNYQDYDEDDGLVYGAEISITSPEPPTKTNTNDRKRKTISNVGSVQIPKPQPGFLPPLHRIITNANNQPQVQTTTSSSTVSIHQSQRQMTAITTATNTSMLRSRVKTKVVPRRVTQNNNSLRPRLDPPTVSITALPPTPEESDFSPNTILILPTEKVSSFCDEDTEIHENPNQRLNLNEYDDEIQIMETRSIIKDEDPQHSSTRSSFGVTDESNSHYDERRSGSEENGNIDSHVIPSTSQNKLEFDDFYMFNIRGYENSTSQSKSDSEMDINNPKHLYENVVEGIPTPLQFVKSEKGYNQLVYDGYLFGKERGTVGKIIWKCTFYTKSGCKGRCHTIDNFVIYHSNNHNHIRELAKIASKEIFSVVE